MPTTAEQALLSEQNTLYNRLKCELFKVVILIPTSVYFALLQNLT